MTPHDSEEGEKTFPVIFPPVTSPLVCCPRCYAAVPYESAQAHVDWHVEAGKKVDAGGFGLGALFGGVAPL